MAGKRQRQSLRASQSGLERLNRARRQRRLTVKATALIEVAGSESTLGRFWRGKPIMADVFKSICQFLGVPWQEVVAIPVRIELDQAPCLDNYKGRSQELQQLQDWLQQRRRLIAILGIGGVGKTTLALALARQLATGSEFEVILWRSLKDAPSLATLLADLLSSLVEEPLGVVPETLEGWIELLLQYLQQHRCLLILDNTESILQRGELAGHYRPGYEVYGQVLHRIAESSHQSCILITSREKSRELALLEGRSLPIQCLQLLGLHEPDARAILQEFDLRGTETDWQHLIERYSGHPLALRLVAATIRDYFGDEIGAFLQQFVLRETVFLGDIQEVLAEQFQRLTPLEQTLMFWLAIAREAIGLSQLQQNLVPTVANLETLLASLDSLVRRSLVERTGRLFTLQPVVMEYGIQQFLQQVCNGLVQPNLSNLNHHPILQATNKDYLRESQIRLIVEPIQAKVGRLTQHQFTELLDALRAAEAIEPGYAAGNLLNLAIQMGIDLKQQNFSHLPIRQAYLRDVPLHQVNFAGANFQETVFSETIANTLNLAFPPDGRTLVSVDEKGWLYVWDLAQERQMAAVRAHREWVLALAISPDGSRIATAGLDSVIQLWHWNGASLTRERSLAGHPIGVAALAFSPDGSLVASAGGDQTVKLWQVETGELQQTLQGHEKLVRTVTFSQTGEWIISGSWDHTIRVWDRQGHCLKQLKGHADAVESITAIALPDLEILNGLVSGSYDQTVKLWNLETGDCVQTFEGHSDRICTVAWTRLPGEGKDPEVLIASAGDDQTIRLWDAESGECWKTLLVSKHRVWALAFAPGGNLIASSSNERLLKLWNPSTGQCWKTIRGEATLTSPIGFNPDNTVAYTFSYDNSQLRHWNRQTGACLQVFPLPVKTSLETRLSPDHRTVAIAGLDHKIHLFAVETGTRLQVLTGHQGWLRVLAFSATHQLASAGGDGTIRVWDLATGDCSLVLAGHPSPVQSLAFSPDGTLLASGGWDQTIKLWRLTTGELLATLTGHTQRIEDLVFSPDGKTLFSGSLDGSIRIWSVATWDCIDSWQVGGNGIVGLRLTPNGQFLVSALYEAEVQVWDLARQQVTQILESHAIYGTMAINSDSSTLATRSSSGDCHLWDITTGQRLQVFHIPRLYEGMNLVGTTGLTPAQQANLQVLGAVVS